MGRAYCEGKRSFEMKKRIKKRWMRWHAFISRHNNITYNYYKCACVKSQGKRDYMRFPELVIGIKISTKEKAAWACL